MTQPATQQEPEPPWAGDVIMAEIKAKVAKLASYFREASFELTWPEIEDLISDYADELLDTYLRSV